jgi:hypothetical protein
MCKNGSARVSESAALQISEYVTAQEALTLLLDALHLSLILAWLYNRLFTVAEGNAPSIVLNGGDNRHDTLTHREQRA